MPRDTPHGSKAPRCPNSVPAPPNSLSQNGPSKRRQPSGHVAAGRCQQPAKAGAEAGGKVSWPAFQTSSMGPPCDPSPSMVPLASALRKHGLRKRFPLESRRLETLSLPSSFGALTTASLGSRPCPPPSQPMRAPLIPPRAATVFPRASPPCHVCVCPFPSPDTAAARFTFLTPVYFFSFSPVLPWSFSNFVFSHSFCHGCASP